MKNQKTDKAPKAPLEHWEEEERDMDEDGDEEENQRERKRQRENETEKERDFARCSWLTASEESVDRAVEDRGHQRVRGQAVQPAAGEGLGECVTEIECTSECTKARTAYIRHDTRARRGHHSEDDEERERGRGPAQPAATGGRGVGRVYVNK